MYVSVWIRRGGPLLVVASGRDTVFVAAEVKRLAPKATYVIQVQLLCSVFAELPQLLPLSSYFTVLLEVEYSCSSCF